MSFVSWYSCCNSCKLFFFLLLAIEEVVIFSFLFFPSYIFSCFRFWFFQQPQKKKVMIEERDKKKSKKKLKNYKIKALVFPSTVKSKTSFFLHSVGDWKTKNEGTTVSHQLVLIFTNAPLVKLSPSTFKVIYPVHLLVHLALPCWVRIEVMLLLKLKCKQSCLNKSFTQTTWNCVSVKLWHLWYNIDTLAC